MIFSKALPDLIIEDVGKKYAPPADGSSGRMWAPTYRRYAAFGGRRVASPPPPAREGGCFQTWRPDSPDYARFVREIGLLAY